MSEHRDPAVEAAQRAHRKVTDGMCTASSERHRITAAREALAPIQKLHESWAEAWATPPMWDEGGTAQNTVQLLLRDLARLIYADKELNR